MQRLGCWGCDDRGGAESLAGMANLEDIVSLINGLEPYWVPSLVRVLLQG